MFFNIKNFKWQSDCYVRLWKNIAYCLTEFTTPHSICSNFNNFFTLFEIETNDSPADEVVGIKERQTINQNKVAR